MTNTAKTVAHTDKLGRVAEDLALIQLATLFEECIVSKIENNQLHDIEIRKKDEKSTAGICRIQVKSTNSKRTAGPYQNYLINMRHGAGMGRGKKAPYERGDIDFFLFYVYPAARFYVVPENAIRGKSGAALYVGLPKPKTNKYEKYLDA